MILPFIRSLEKFRKLVPSTFSIEVVLGCNLKCPECKIGNGTITRKKGSMSFDQYKIIADKIRPYAKYVYLHIWGEPLLNRDIIKIIEYTAEFSKTNISTNGQLITESVARDLVNSGLTDIIVSIDGTTQYIYEQYRVGGSLSKAMSALKLLQKEKQDSNSSIRIIPQFVVFRHNEHQIDSFKTECRNLGLKPSFKAPYLTKGSGIERSTISKYWRKTGDMYKDCRDVTEVMSVFLDGTVVPCYYDVQGEHIFGNLFIQDVLDIWNSPECSAFRYGVYSGKGHTFCNENCLAVSSE